MNGSGLKLTFLGGAGTVTGSKHLLTAGQRRVLIDCGLFQGAKEQRLLNWSPLSIDAKTIAAVILTHAHLDHTGYLPLLIKQGFRGPIYCSEPTSELTKLVLLDSAKIQEEEAEHANREGYSKHKPALPLYRTADAEAVFPFFETRSPGSWHPILSGEARMRLQNSGHILGSTFVEIEARSERVVFSGDLGRAHPLTLNPRELIEEADSLVLESTYGDRCHPKEPPGETLAKIIDQTLDVDGQILIPTFAIGRTQDILHLIASLKAAQRIPDLPVYLDSPMASQATSIFDRYTDWHRMTSPDLKRLSATFRHVATPEQSASLSRSKDPAIILAGSGMLTGGRIQQHLMSRLPQGKNTVVLVGYQAAGTLGRFLKEGVEEAKIFGRYIPVRARITEISSLSAHADQSEILEWLGGFTSPPKRIFLVHGETGALEGLRVRVTDRLGTVPHIARLGETVP
ncbi:MAG TPA: MBL fold metallo-hydrolase [Bdellovibrionota bacterium]|nr:MBL fold metallo-hydrolase [Bdellovibrionota bacterium]